MYCYTLNKYLRDKIKKKGFLEWAYVHGLLKDQNLHVESGFNRDSYKTAEALSHYSDVVFYSPKKVLQVPARNGILLPVSFYEETEI